jgi:Na+-driven multidrug efflux pump
MAFLRENLWALIAITSAIAAALAYVFAMYVEKKPDNKDDAESAPRQAAFKTFAFAFVSGAVLLWFSRSEAPSAAPFQES